jgi:hypothetical protein
MTEPSLAHIPAETEGGSAERLRRIDRLLGQFSSDDRQWLTAQLATVDALRLRQERKRRRDEAMRMVRAEFLADLSDRAAADEIAAAVRQRRAIRADTEAARSVALRRSTVRRRIEELLGSIAEVPGPSRIRQVIGDK